MQDMREQDTVFYKLKLKRTKTPAEVFEKMQKQVKKKGATKNWTCTVDSENMSMTVDFGDGISESFFLSFDEKKQCEGCCKVFFPLSGELFDDEKKSEFKAFLNMIYAVRTSFSVMEITDDYGIAESFLDSKVNKITLRDLTEDESERAERLFSGGHTEVKDFICALLCDYRGLVYSGDIIPHINSCISCHPIMFWSESAKLKFSDYLFAAFVESFLYEATEYADEGRLYTVDDYYGELNGVFFAVYAFVFGIENITGCPKRSTGWDPKSTQILRLYSNKYVPLVETEKSDYGRCILAYRFMVSTLDFLRFKYVGRGDRNLLIDEQLAEGAKTMTEHYSNKEWVRIREEYFKRVKK